MIAPEARAPARTTVHPSSSELLASALVHLVDRDEPVPARWRSEAFAASVARHRVILGSLVDSDALERLAKVIPLTSFSGAAAALARDPFAAALAVRRIELARGSHLPAWPDVARHGVAPDPTRSAHDRWAR